jgi:putative membrane protein
MTTIRGRVPLARVPLLLGSILLVGCDVPSASLLPDEPSLSAGPVWCPWCGSHMSGWGWPMMMFSFLILLVLVIAAAWALIQRGGFSGWTEGRGDSAEGILRQRYARGEIDDETYRRMLEELRRGSP